MRREFISSVVNATCASLSEGELEELLSRKDKRPTQLVNEQDINRRRGLLDEGDLRSTRVDFERILGQNDLVGVSYLIRAQMAARTVCKVILRDEAGRELGSGTGFKVAPRILMTNHHVLESVERARLAVCEFNNELDEHGSPRQTTRFGLDPESFFLADRELDFAVVAIAEEPNSGPGQLADFGFQRLIKELGKLNDGEFVSIIQHPGGRPKQIALRENKVLRIQGDVIWYTSDTAQGSSGSPVLNDAWQVVGLHHSGVPRTENGDWLRKDGRVAGPQDGDGEIDWIANEGIRCSRIVARIEAELDGSAHADEFLAASTGALMPQPSLPHLPAGGGILPQAPPPGSAQISSDRNLDQPELSCEPIAGGARITVPVSFRLTLAGQAPIEVPRPEPSTPREPVGAEVTKTPIIDPNYGNRRGYQADFLGGGALAVERPTVMSARRMVRMENGETSIPYQHFSIVMDRFRRLAIYTAANVDGRRAARRPEAGRQYTRKALGGFGRHDRERWLLEPRIPARFQLSDRFYNLDRTSFDKGHLVRRDDVCFGGDYAEVQRANGDTYHITNCSPQVRGFNRSMEGGDWGKLENHILRDAKDERLCVFSGPVLSRRDPHFAGVDDAGAITLRIPRAYWKVIVAVAADGSSLETFAFLLHQDLSDTQMEFDPGHRWRTSMLSMKKLQRTVRLEFPDALVEADQYRRRRPGEARETMGLDALAVLSDDADLAGLDESDEGEESGEGGESRVELDAPGPAAARKVAKKSAKAKKTESES